MVDGDGWHGRFSPVRPLLAGDVLGGKRVAGFAWQPRNDGKTSTHLDDKLVLVGDEHLVTPPERVVPQTSEGALECAPMPPADLDDGRVRPGASVGPTVPHRVDALLDLPGAPWQPVARLLFASVHATGHRVWLSGGVVRDVVSGVGERRINDLDLSGTVPAGRFTDILYQSLRASRMSEFRTTITPDSLVCAVTQPGSNERLIEYRGLAATGFRFPAVGSSLAEDVRQRDFTFNALYYDILDHQLFDPSGCGVADLAADKRKFVPLMETDDPCAQGRIVIRAMKFALHWAGVPEPDLKDLNAWLTSLDPELCQGFTAGQWRKLTRAYQRVATSAKAEQRAFAARLEQPGRELLETLIGAAT